MEFRCTEISEEKSRLLLLRETMEKCSEAEEKIGGDFTANAFFYAKKAYVTEFGANFAPDKELKYRNRWARKIIDSKKDLQMIMEM